MNNNFIDLTSQGNDVNFITALDNTDPNNIYVGNALPGTPQSAALWKITKIITSGNIITILLANSNSNYSNIWNNRASLTYG